MDQLRNDLQVPPQHQDRASVVGGTAIVGGAAMGSSRGGERGLATMIILRCCRFKVRMGSAEPQLTGTKVSSRHTP